MSKAEIRVKSLFALRADRIDGTDPLFAVIRKSLVAVFPDDNYPSMNFPPNIDRRITNRVTPNRGVRKRKSFPGCLADNCVTQMPSCSGLRKSYVKHDPRERLRTAQPRIPITRYSLARFCA